MTPHAPLREHVIETEAGRIATRIWNPEGAGIPLILLHDSLGCMALWRDFPARLAEATGRRVIAYDRRGFGASEARTDRLDPLGFIAAEATGDFATVTRALGITRFALLGHSVGGGMGLCIAAARPKDCAALVTLSAQTFAEARTLDGIRTAREDFKDPAQLARLARYHGDKAAWVLSAWIDSWLDPSFAGWSLDDTLPRITTPILAIHGAEDEYGSPAHPQRIADLAAGPVTLRLLSGVGHFPHRSDEAGITAETAAFLKENA